ncbi:TolC family protein [Sphingobacterium hungaricum]
MNNKFCLVLVLLLWLPAWGVAQQQLTLAECMQIGIENNLTFKIEQMRIAFAEKSKRSTASRFLPRLAGGINHNYDLGSAIDPATNNRITANFQYDNFFVQSEVNLFNFSELRESKIQEKDYQLALANKEIVEQEYLLTLITYYYEALASQEWKKVIQQQIINSEEQVNRIKNEVLEGAKPVSDEYDIQVLYSNEKKLVEQAVQDELNKKMILLQWLNVSDGKTDETLLLNNPEISLIALADSTTNDPRIHKEELAKLKLEEEYKQLLSAYLPNLRLSYSYNTFYSNAIDNIFRTSFQFGSQLKDNKNQFLGLGLSIPIYSRGDHLRNRTKKSIQILEQEQLIKKTEIEVRNQFQNERRKLVQFQSLEPILAESLAYSKRSLETTESKFEFGKVDISAYRLAKNQVLSSSYELLTNGFSKEMTAEVIKVLYSE